jgi:hypothetical protein
MPLRVLICHSCVLVFFKRPKACACCLGVYLFCNKVIQHEARQNHTYECENHTQRVKITLVRLVRTQSGNLFW